MLRLERENAGVTFVDVEKAGVGREGLSSHARGQQQRPREVIPVRAAAFCSCEPSFQEPVHSFLGVAGGTNEAVRR